MKYLGGKQRLGKHLQVKLHEIFEKNKLSGYMEPFCGSLGVMKHMTDLKTKTIMANDYHSDLIALWEAVQSDTFVYPKSISEEEYLAAKQLKSPNAYKAFVTNYTKPVHNPHQMNSNAQRIQISKGLYKWMCDKTQHINL